MATTVRFTIGTTIDGAAIKEMHAALDEAENSPECRIFVLQGGDGVFCTGMDLEQAATGDAKDGGADFFGLLKRFTTTPRAVVAQVDGRVAGGGVGLAAASDFVYASERSTFSLPEALWGLLPCCVLPFLIRRAGFQKAYTMTFSTQPVSAAEAERFQLVDEVTADPGAVIKRLAYRLTKLDESVIGDMKRYFRDLWIISDAVEEKAVGEFGRLMSTPEVRQRLSDYATEKRFPWER
ncbi:enoyl-CoA hydratase-related protein [Nonomuraea soli]|uniref:Polyketide biosynthesis enoyl-CoA hydratase PksH n=1 Tax=Nonomuraea soli TaxID=1032476 RepID=A0A7W0CQR0_9ACTN|nr:enoyl-CoA hydratase-related protein [Nonomuraea soli]MBA2895400.1 polyketide biosynthesis enoyl-CoA hydratase PksH [Nonomuraea soli]